MATSRAANIVEKAMRHPDEASIATDVSNYSKDKCGERAQKIKALTWQGKNSVKVGRRSLWICFQSPNPCDVILLIGSSYVLSAIVETAKPKVLDDGDVIVKVTGSTICGSDLHLYHGM